MDRGVGEAVQRVPVPLLEHRPYVYHDLAAVCGVRDLLRQEHLAVVTQVQYQTTLLRILGLNDVVYYLAGWLDVS